MKNFTLTIFLVLSQTLITLANDNCSNATILTPSSSCTTVNSTFSGATLVGAPPSCSPNASQDIWFQFIANDSIMRIELSAVQGLDHGFEIIKNSCGGTSLMCVNDGGMNTKEIYFSNQFEVNETYYVRVFNTSNTPSTLNFTICIQTYPAPSNNNCTDAIELSVHPTGCLNTSGTFSGASATNSITTPCGNAISQDVWYKFIASHTSVNIQLSAVNGLNHGFQVFEGDCTGSQIKCENSKPQQSTEIAIVNGLTIGETYYVRVFNDSSLLNFSNFNICIFQTPTPCPPTISISTTQTTICSEDTVIVLSYHTNSGITPTFNWTKNGIPISGYNSSVLQTSHLSNGDQIQCTLTSSAMCALGLPDAVSNTITFAVNPATPATFTQIGPICKGSTFSLPSVSNNNFTGTWTPAINLQDTTTYTFKPASGQCAGTSTMTVAIQPKVKPIFDTPIQGLCRNAPNPPLPTISNNQIPGVWHLQNPENEYRFFHFTPDSGYCADTTSLYIKTILLDSIVYNYNDYLNVPFTIPNSTYQWVDCSTNMPIQGATSVDFYPTQNGSYKVIINNENCTKESLCINVTSLGTTNQNDLSVIRLFPNPSSNEIFILTNAYEEGQIYSIIDATGRTLIEGLLYEKNQCINIQSLSPGMYYVKLLTQDKAIKFIKY